MLYLPYYSCIIFIETNIERMVLFMPDMLNLSKEESLQMLNLRKDSFNKLCLDKTPLHNLTSRVGVVLDYSGSMSTLYRNGTVQAVLERLFPIALQFDDNGEMELWIFDDGFHRLDNISMDNYYGYIEREVIRKYDMGCTEYAPVLRDIYSKYMLEEPANLPNYIIFITDGDNSDKSAATHVITEMSKYPIFIQFVGIGSSSMNYLEELDTLEGRYVDNANFFRIRNINSEKDEALYSKLIEEYPTWLEYPEVKEMISKQGAEPNPPLFGKPRESTEKKGFFSRFFH